MEEMLSVTQVSAAASFSRSGAMLMLFTTTHTYVLTLQLKAFPIKKWIQVPDGVKENRERC